jgi:hypothetical protein
MPRDESKPTYHRTTVSLTAEQHEWLRRVALQAQLDGVSLSAGDVIRLAVTRLQDQLAPKQLRKELVEHVLSEVERYPGRAKRGLPSRAAPKGSHHE